MTYNRTSAKNLATQRQEERKSLARVQQHTLSTWAAPMPPYSPRCHRCGVRTTSSTPCCPVCGASL